MTCHHSHDITSHNIAVEVQNEGLLVSLGALLGKVDVIVHEVSRMQAGEC